jgi:hypothetical protein
MTNIDANEAAISARLAILRMERKLRIKDEISALQDLLIPDIIA